MSIEEDINFLEEFREKITEYLFLGYAPTEIHTYWRNEGLIKMRTALKKPEFQQLRREINEMKGRAHQILSDNSVACILTQYPAPAVGGPVLNFALFDLVTENRVQGGTNVTTFTDRIDEAIGTLKNRPREETVSPHQELSVSVSRGFVFIAMAMAPDDPQLEDVHDAIKEAASALGLIAERVDERATNERITDRILDSIQKAEFVIADLTNSKPNVFYEAGYAHALGKIPIYIAREETSLEFDVKDYPVIFFKNIRELRLKLNERLSRLIEARQ